MRNEYRDWQMEEIADLQDENAKLRKALEVISAMGATQWEASDVADAALKAALGGDDG